jgi:hypothetical protein
MSDLRELLAVDHRTALEFFHTGLKDFAPEKEKIVGPDETMYVASVLAHHAQVSCRSTVDMPTPATLLDIFDNFVLNTSPEQRLFETAGGQSLLLLGFFSHQMRRRHSLTWYTDLGINYYQRASVLCTDAHKSFLLRRISGNFRVWTHTCRKLDKELREKPFLLN